MDKQFWSVYVRPDLSIEVALCLTAPRLFYGEKGNVDFQKLWGTGVVATIV